MLCLLVLGLDSFCGITVYLIFCYEVVRVAGVYGSIKLVIGVFRFSL